MRRWILLPVAFAGFAAPPLRDPSQAQARGRAKIAEAICGLPRYTCMETVDQRARWDRMHQLVVDPDWLTTPSLFGLHVESDKLPDSVARPRLPGETDKNMTLVYRAAASGDPAIKICSANRQRGRSHGRDHDHTCRRKRRHDRLYRQSRVDTEWGGKRNVRTRQLGAEPKLSQSIEEVEFEAQK